MSGSYHPLSHCRAVELRIGSFGSPLKAVIYPPFLCPALSGLNVLWLQVPLSLCQRWSHGVREGDGHGSCRRLALGGR